MLRCVGAFEQPLINQVPLLVQRWVPPKNERNLGAPRGILRFVSGGWRKRRGQWALPLHVPVGVLAFVEVGGDAVVTLSVA